MDPLKDLYAEHHLGLRRSYESLMEGSPWAGIVVSSGDPVPVFDDDQSHPFRVAAGFRQWVPEGDYTHSFLVIRPGSRPLLICHQPADYWHAAAAAPGGFWVDHFDVVCVPTPEDADRALPARRDGWAFLGDPSSCPPGISPDAVNPLSLHHALAYRRAYKTGYEVECMRRANRIAAAGHLAAREAFAEGAAELDIHFAYLAATRQDENTLPYPNIIALNEHGATLHYERRDPVAPESGRSFLIDAGADYLGYAADITRTWSAADDDFGALVERLDGAQRTLSDRIAVGAPFVELHLEMHRLIGGVLRDAGLVDLDPDDMVEEGVTSVFFPHGLGHHLGLQVHDVGGKLADERGTPIRQPEGHPFLRNLRPVEASNVFTVEPGLYFIPQLLDGLRGSRASRNVCWERVDTLTPFGGVRIEDDVHVTPDGLENLTRDAFLALED